jgi:hypothetical protein
MNKNIYLTILVVVIVAGAIFLYSKNNDTKDLKNESEYNPEINPLEFTSKVDSPYFTLTPGKKTVYEAKTEDGVQRIEFYVTNEKKKVLGVDTVVVWDRAWLDGSLIEDTRDWFAQDKEGNVWYFGEDTKEYENGQVTSTKGSWEAGIDGAKPGIIMKTNPQVGDSYREEYYKDQAEDKADVLSLTESVTVPLGSYSNCLKTKNYTALEPDVIEYKYYCKEVGNTALEIDGDERAELIKVEYNATPS